MEERERLRADPDFLPANKNRLQTGHADARAPAPAPTEADLDPIGRALEACAEDKLPQPLQWRRFRLELLKAAQPPNGQGRISADEVVDLLNRRYAAGYRPGCTTGT